MLSHDLDPHTAELQQIQQRLESQVLETRASLVRAVRQAEVEALEAELESRLAQLDQAHRTGMAGRPRRPLVGSVACIAGACLLLFFTLIGSVACIAVFISSVAYIVSALLSSSVVWPALLSLSVVWPTLLAHCCLHQECGLHCCLYR